MLLKMSPYALACSTMRDSRKRKSKWKRSSHAKTSSARFARSATNSTKTILRLNRQNKMREPGLNPLDSRSNGVRNVATMGCFSLSTRPGSRQEGKVVMKQQQQDCIDPPITVRLPYARAHVAQRLREAGK